MEQKQYSEDILNVSAWFHIILFLLHADYRHTFQNFVFHQNYVLWKATPVSPCLSDLQILTSQAKIWQEY